MTRTASQSGPFLPTFALNLRLVSIFLVLLFLFGSSAQGVSHPLIGDANDDGKVNVGDAVLLLRATVHLASLSPEQLPQSDLNHDGQVNVTDAVTLLNSLANHNPLSSPSTPPATAHFYADPLSGQVYQIPGSSDVSSAQSVFGGSRVRFNFEKLVDEPGDTGRKVLSVSLTNTTNEPMGTSPNGTESGVKLIFSDFSNTLTDLRTHVQVNTWAGTGAAGSADGAAGNANFGGPGSVARTSDGTLYVTDYVNQTVRKIKDGQVSTLAGSGAAGSSDGGGAVASFNNPAGIALNPLDGSLVVADRTGNRLRRVTSDGTVTTIAGTGASGGADGPGNISTFAGPWGVAVDTDGTIYVAEFDGHRVRKVSFTGSDPRLSSSYTVSTVAGDGTPGVADGVGASAHFTNPLGIAVSGGVVYIAEYGSHRVRRIAKTGEVTTVAGTGVSGGTDGSGNVAQFKNPSGIAVVNGMLVVSEAARLRQVVLKQGGSPSQSSSWKVATLAGTGVSGATNGRGDVAQFASPFGMASDEGGSVYVADFSNKRVRKVTLDNGYFRLGEPTGISPSEAVQLSNGEGRVGFNNGTSELALPYLLYPGSLQPGVTSEEKKWAFIVPQGVSAFEFNVTVEAATNTLTGMPTVSNPGPGGVGSPDAWVRTYAGGSQAGFVDGPAVAAAFNAGGGTLAADAVGDLFVCDQSNNAIRRIGVDGQVTTIGGLVGSGPGSTDGLGTVAKFFYPSGIAVTADGKTVYVADFELHIIRRLALVGSDPTEPSQWSVSTIAGLAGTGAQTLTTGTNDKVTGNAARFYSPSGLVLVGERTLYVTELFANRVRRIQYRGGDPTLAISWFVTTIAGALDGSSGSTNGTGTSARFHSPQNITADGAGSLYITDIDNHLIRKITDPETDTGGLVNTFAGSTSGYSDGTGVAALFNTAVGIAADSAGYLYVTDNTNNRIRRISPGGVVTTVAGTGASGGLDGPGNAATFANPLGLTVDATGNLYVGDNFSRIRLIQRLLR